MTPSDDEIQNEDAADKKRKGEGDMTSGGAAYEGVVTEEDAARKTAKVARLSTEKTKQVWNDFVHHDINAIMNVVVEFFAEWPMRASAHLKVDWNKVKGNSKSFALINWTIDAGTKAVREFIRARERTRGADVKGLRFRRSHRPRHGTNSDPNSGPVGAG
jgi:hypothetical protein